MKQITRKVGVYFENFEKTEIIFTEELLSKVYAILVECAGANGDNYEIMSFICSHLEGKYPCHEWRFGGELGFGGKFRIESMRVDCYSEDRTPKRKKIIEKTNLKLKELIEKERK